MQYAINFHVIEMELRGKHGLEYNIRNKAEIEKILLQTLKVLLMFKSDIGFGSINPDLSLWCARRVLDG